MRPYPVARLIRPESLGFDCSCGECTDVDVPLAGGCLPAETAVVRPWRARGLLRRSDEILQLWAENAEREGVPPRWLNQASLLKATCCWAVSPLAKEPQLLRCLLLPGNVEVSADADAGEEGVESSVGGEKGAEALGDISQSL